MTRRMEKVADQLQVEVADLLRREVKHHALADLMLSITRVEVAPDLTTARIHVSVMDLPGRPPTDMDAVIEALTRTEPFLHRELVRRLHMRQIPRLKFLPDHSIEEGARMTHLMREVAQSEGREL
ncbi:MAG: 30S ribosome-binding factor RbfA [Dehalococcoidia bacterium]|nr:30S ribosome-binding factor RbfA [Dehalococcoidia bacterium]